MDLIKDIEASNSHGFESQNNDRPYTSQLFTRIHSSLGTDGFSPTLDNRLDLIKDGNKSATLRKGAAIVFGHFFELTAEANIDFTDVAVGTQSRYDIIAVRIDRSSGERKVSLIKFEGTLAAEPKIPYDQLKTEFLDINSGVADFPLYIVHVKQAALTQEDIQQAIPSSDPLDPRPSIIGHTKETATTTIYRVLIPILTPIDSIKNSRVRILFAPTTADTDALIILNDFDDTGTPIPLLKADGTQFKTQELQGREFEVKFAGDLTKAEIIGYADIEYDDGTSDSYQWLK